MGLIQAPDLDIRNAEQLAAEAISHVSTDCPELTNDNASSPHTVLLETMAWLMEQMTYRINQLNPKTEIEFARMFGIVVREASKATTTLQFTVIAPSGTPVTVPQGTEVATADGLIFFETDEALTIPADTLTGTVGATRTVAGHTLLSPATLTNLIDSVAYVAAVTNLLSVDSGTEAETVQEALERARSYQRRAERIVSAKDLEEAVLQDVLQGNGIVKAFPFIRNGDWETNRAGETTLIVMTKAGLALSENEKVAIRSILGQMVGSQFIYVLDPEYVTFNVKAASGLVPQATINAAVGKKLREFYAPSASNFGRRIARSEIIAVIEGTEGVDRIATDGTGALLLTSPAVDIVLAPYELPQVVSTSITVIP